MLNTRNDAGGLWLTFPSDADGSSRPPRGGCSALQPLPWNGGRPAASGTRASRRRSRSTPPTNAAPKDGTDVELVCEGSVRRALPEDL